MIFLFSHGFREKCDAFECFRSLFKLVSEEKHALNESIVKVRTDNDIEFQNVSVANFFLEHNILHEFSTPISGVVDCK